MLLLLLEFSVEVAFLVYPGMRSVASSLVLGVLMALIGLNIQHDANHGAMSGTVGKVWGYLFGLSQDWIGGSSVMWIHQHVVLHHIHCNDADKDPDMGGAPLFRTHKADGPARWYMRAQHVYMFLLESIYGLVPLFGTIPALKNWRHQNDEKWAISPLAKNPHQFRVRPFHECARSCGRACKCTSMLMFLHHPAVDRRVIYPRKHTLNHKTGLVYEGHFPCSLPGPSSVYLSFPVHCRMSDADRDGGRLLPGPFLFHLPQFRRSCTVW